MEIIELIKDQIQSVKEKTDSFIISTTEKDWNFTPQIIETNFNWQIGHIVLANYLHGVASISGVNEKVRALINIPNFIKFYGINSNPNLYFDEKPNSEELISQYEMIFELIFVKLNNLKIEDLEKNTEIPNPGAKTKYEALTTLIKHQSWHNGQIAILKRLLGKDN
jgi:hypothetical protein